MKKTSMLFTFAGIFFAIIFAFPANAEVINFTKDQIDAANSIENAILLENGGEYNHDQVISATEKSKYETFFKIPVKPGERLALHGLFGKTGAPFTNIIFYRADGDQIAKAIVSKGDENVSIYYTIGNNEIERALSENALYVKFLFDKKANGFQFLVEIDNKGDAGTQQDAANAKEYALAIEEGVYEKNFLTSESDYSTSSFGNTNIYFADDATDCYSLQIDSNKKTTIKIVPDSDLGKSASSLDVEVRDSDNELRARSSSKHGGSFSVDVDAQSGEILYFCVSETIGSFFGSYKMDISSTPIKAEPKAATTKNGAALNNADVEAQMTEFAESANELEGNIVSGVETAKKTAKMIFIGVIVVGLLFVISMIAIIVHVIKKSKSKGAASASTAPTNTQPQQSVNPETPAPQPVSEDMASAVTQEAPQPQAKPDVTAQQQPPAPPSDNQ